MKKNKNLCDECIDRNCPERKTEKFRVNCPADESHSLISPQTPAIIAPPSLSTGGHDFVLAMHNVKVAIYVSIFCLRMDTNYC